MDECLPVAELNDDEVISQFGTASGGFKNAPGPNDDGSLSTCWGQLSPAAMVYLVCDYRTRVRPSKDLVRQTTAGKIRNRDARFRVRHDPVVENPLHASVEFDGEWNEEVEDMFRDCFPEERNASDV